MIVTTTTITMVIGCIIVMTMIIVVVDDHDYPCSGIIRPWPNYLPLMSKRKTKTTKSVRTPEGGNVYADLGYSDAEEMLIKAGLVRKISEIVRNKGLTQVQTAKILGLTQPKISALFRGQFRGISERKLIECLTSLDVEIVIKDVPRRRAGGKVTVVLA